jgi:hypothetical protein
MVVDDIRAGSLRSPPAHRAGAVVIYVEVGALVLANLAATIPGPEAARTPAAVLVHAE